MGVGSYIENLEKIDAGLVLFTLRFKINIYEKNKKQQQSHSSTKITISKE